MAAQEAPITASPTRSKTGHGAAITSVALNEAHVTIDIPSGKGGILYAVEIALTFIAASALNAGGAVRFRNSSADWDPFYIPTGVYTVVTEGGDALKPFVFHCWKKLPGNSTVTVDYIPNDNLSQYLEITLHWYLTERDPEMETFVDIVHPLYADVIGSTTRTQVVTSWAHNAADVIPIPGHKGGTLKAVILQVFPTSETIVLGGGLIEYFVDSHDITPMEFYTTMMTVVGASGANCVNPQVIPHSHEVKANSNYSAWVTNRDNQNQTTTFGVIWERPYDTKR